MASQLEICNMALDLIGEKNISAAELAAESPKAARLVAAHWDIVLDEVLDAHPWNFAKKHWPLEYAPGFAEYLSTDSKTITDISTASPGNVEAVAHGFLTDYTVKIDDVVGMTEVNDRIFQITKVDADNFTLNGIDTAQYTAYTSGGTVVRLEALSEYSDGYTYKVPSDLLRPLALEGGGEFEIIGGGGATNATQRILTTVDDAVLIGISTRTTATELTSRFIKVLTARLAAQIAFAITKKRDIEKSMWDLYGYHLGDSAVKDSRESNIKPNTKDSWLVDAGYE
jgi:hypothetical protein